VIRWASSPEVVTLDLGGIAKHDVPDALRTVRTSAFASRERPFRNTSSGLFQYVNFALKSERDLGARASRRQSPAVSD